MAENGGTRRSSTRLKRPVEEKKVVVEKEEDSGVPESKDEKSDEEEEESVELARAELRNRWELASVLNFFGVFEPVIGGNLKMSAEEIEEALVKPNDLLAKLHVTLLKGILPVSKSLGVPDAWITVLCKKLVDWWPWVAEGEIPLTASKGREEIARYKELDPTTRLMMLKALCEVRMEEDDLKSYINDTIKQGTEPSSFRKDRIGDGGSRTSYWYDGNMVIGHRLYREVYKFKSKNKGKGKSSVDPIVNNIEWETLATNLDEFRKVLDKFSSSKIGAEVAVCKLVETDIIPILEDLQKKKERALKRQQRQEHLLKVERSYAVSVRGSTRARKPVSYTFDAYDHAIDEAIKMSKKRSREQLNGDMHGRRNLRSNADSDADSEQSDGSVDSMDEDENPSIHGGDNAANHVESSGNSTKINERMTDGEEDVDRELDPENGNIGNDKKRMKSYSQGQINDDNDSDASKTSSQGTDDPSGQHQPVGDARKLSMQKSTTQNGATEVSDRRESSSDHTSSSEGGSKREDHSFEVDDSEDE